MGVDSERSIDLFGHPVREGHGSRGRPPYEPNDEDRNKIKLLLALGWSISRMANAIDVSPATLKRYFRAELKQRDAMRDRLEARRFELAMRMANEGNIAALKELGRMIEHNDLMTYGQTTSVQPKEVKLGKKETDLAAAKLPDPGTPLGELMARRQGTVVN